MTFLKYVDLLAIYFMNMAVSSDPLSEGTNINLVMFWGIGDAPQRDFIFRPGSGLGLGRGE